MKKLILLLLVSLSQIMSGQQDQQLFLMHYLGESNFMNPAVQSDCKWFIGIPVLSSVHANYSNNAFSYHQLVKSTDSSKYIVDINDVVKDLGRRTIIEAELHTTLFALGYKRRNLYFAFSIIDKINLPLTLPKDVISLIWKGNTQFEGKEVGLKGTSVYFTYYREFALGISKKDESGNFMGIKGKLLFGKLNLSMPNSSATLYTDPSTFDILINGPVDINMSAPIIINQNNGRINSFSYDQSVEASDFYLNRKNWGIAFDWGFIKKYDEKTTVSGSILDLGFIRWRSNLNNIHSSGHFYYNGPLGDTLQSATYVNDLINSFQDSMQTVITNKSYTTFLPTRFYLGGTYAILRRINTDAVLSAVLYDTKLVTEATVLGDYNPGRSFHIIISYTLMYRSFNNVGLGLSLGKGPVQFYAISDNFLGIIWPLSARDINLRFGLNINLGCRLKNYPENTIWPSGSNGSCPCYKQDELRSQRKASWE